MTSSLVKEMEILSDSSSTHITIINLIHALLHVDFIHVMIVYEF